GSQLVKNGERVELPHGRLGPQAVERQQKLAVFDRQRIFRQFEISFQPFQKSRFENATAAVESVTSQPNQFGFSKLEFPNVLHLLRNIVGWNQLREAHRRRAIQK